MQELQAFSGGSSRIFGGGGGFGADHRRLRGYTVQQQQQPLKCPRCESMNTKFCYYNNYNLSQPRHFCKSCRRYWTKGGVLRNVPLGGGSRKNSKHRSSSSSSSSKPSKSSSAGKNRRRSSGSGSSSDSSTLTAPTESTVFPSHSPNPDPSFDPSPPVGPEIFPEAGSFTSLMAGDGNSMILGFNFSDPSQFRLPAQQSQQPEIKMHEMTAGFMDQTVHIDLPTFESRVGGGGIIGLDWQGVVDPGLFDLTSAVDQGVYWNHNHWGESDPFLHLP